MKLHKTCQTDLWGNFSCSRVYLTFSQRALSSHGARGACIKTQTSVLTAGRIEARSKRRRSIYIEGYRSFFLHVRILAGNDSRIS